MSILQIARINRLDGAMLKWIKKKILKFAADTRGLAPVEKAIMFSAAAIAITVILGPMISSTGEQVAMGRSDGIDRTVTGSIGNSSPVERYTVRRSVLQASRDARCIIFADGISEGDC